MLSEDHHLLKPPGHPGSVWRTLRASYRFANLTSHHLIGFVLKFSLFIYFLLALLFLILRYIILPNIDVYKHNIEDASSQVLGHPVSIARVDASWRGLNPNLLLTDVLIRDANGRPALTLPSVSATFSWWSVFTASLRFEDLEVIRPDLDIRRTSDGKVYIAGLLISTKGDGGGGLDWLLAQREIVIRDGRLRWIDETRISVQNAGSALSAFSALPAAPAAPAEPAELALDGVNLVLQNKWLQHKAALRASPPADFAAPVDIRLDFVHPPFVSRVSDVQRWKGVLFADVRNTDLALWKKYIDFPIDTLQGIGSVRAWLSFDHAKLADFTADLRLRDAEVRLQAVLPVLELAKLEGRILASEIFDALMADGKPTFGTLGHTVKLTQVSLETKDGLRLETDLIEEKYTPATRLEGEIFEVKASSLDLETLAGLAGRIPLSPEIRQALLDFAPQGKLNDFSARWQGRQAKLEHYQFKAEFLGLAMKPQAARTQTVAGKTIALPAIPGFERLSGRIDANEKGGQLKLASDGLQLQLGAYFADPDLIFQKLSLDGAWQIIENERLFIDVKKMAFDLDGFTGQISAQHTLPLGAKQARTATATATATATVTPLTDINATFSGFELGRVKRFLPFQTPTGLKDWLTGSLDKGTVQDIQLKLKGDLQHFPFKADSVHEKKGEFLVVGKIKQGSLIYVPGSFGKDGKSPVWPELEEVEAKITFDRSRLEIIADSGKTHGTNLTYVKAVIPDFIAKNMIVEIDGITSGNLNDLLRYVIDSPVSGMISHFTDESRSTGPAKLALKFSMPLDHPLDIKVQGNVQLGGNTILLQNILPEFTQSTGKIEFSERGFSLNGVTAQFCGGPIQVQGGSTRENGVQVRANGSVTTDGVRRAYPAPTMQRLADYIQGGTRYAANISVKKGQTEIVVDSNLDGVGLRFPAPLNKNLNESIPFRLQLLGQPTEDGGIARDEIKMSLGSGIKAHYWRQKTGRGDWQVLRGGIGVNEAAPEPASGLQMNLNMKSINVDAWLNVTDAVTNAATSASTGNESQTKNNPGDGISLAQYVDADTMTARTNELLFLGKKLENVVAGISIQKKIWQVNIDSNQVSGYLTWNHVGPTIGKVTGRLGRLTIPESVASDVSDLLEGKTEATNIPALDLVAESFELFNKKLGRLEVVADNVRAEKLREWRISKLSLVNPDAELNATGKWVTGEGRNNTQLVYTLGISDAGKMLDRFGFANVLRGGKGKIDGELNWDGLPFSLDIPSLWGPMNLQVTSGQFIKVEPGAAKLLGVLSLQALPRLLKLDFRDVFSEGFAFDSIDAQANINKGVLTTNNLKMRGVSATVLMEGSADIEKETQNLHVVVIPDFNVGTAAVLYGLAVNPVIGLGSFVAQLLLKDPVAKAFTFQYSVSGSWKEPMVNKLDSKVAKTGANTELKPN
jgi:uncharacterized protein (TIGR02099 family)